MQPDLRKAYAEKGIELGEDKTDEIILKLGGQLLKVDTLSTSIPPKLIKKPTLGGMVVPYTATMDKNGKPLFGVLDEEKRIKCANERLCGVCGDQLGYWIFFIGGPRSLWTSAFIDPPMHGECATYSMAICPYLRHAPMSHPSTLPTPVNEKIEQYQKRVADPELINTYNIVREGRPEYLGMVLTRRYQFGVAKRSKMDQTQAIFVAGTFKQIWWYAGVTE